MLSRPAEYLETAEMMEPRFADAGSFEVWNSFNSSVHHQHDAVGADLVMTERTELLELAGPSVGVNTGIWPQSASSRASKWSLEEDQEPNKHRGYGQSLNGVGEVRSATTFGKDTDQGAIRFEWRQIAEMEYEKTV